MSAPSARSRTTSEDRAAPPACGVPLPVFTAPERKSSIPDPKPSTFPVVSHQLIPVMTGAYAGPLANTASVARVLSRLPLPPAPPHAGKADCRRRGRCCQRAGEGASGRAMVTRLRAHLWRAFRGGGDFSKIFYLLRPGAVGSFSRAHSCTFARANVYARGKGGELARVR